MRSETGVVAPPPAPAADPNAPPQADNPDAEPEDGDEADQPEPKRAAQ